jgi:acyl-CoA reductase-like NAD-dependent aldehyde dehydrogenase
MSNPSVLERRNPSDRNDLVFTQPVTSASELASVVDCAVEAAARWRKLTGPARADHLYRWGDAIAARNEELAQAIAREVGKPIGEARGEVARATVILRYYAGEAVRDVGEVIPAQTPDTLQFTVRDPLGVVALITPWNFPVAIPIWKAAPALAFGNGVVLKVQTARDAGIPDGLFGTVSGAGEVGAALIDAPGVSGVSFTGSARVGALVAAAASRRNVPFQTEMGGKNAVIVLADADLQRAAMLTAAGAFRYAGQKCTATSRAIVDRRVATEFSRALASATAQLSLGPVVDAAAAVGPMITPEARDRVVAAIAASPAERLLGGELPSDANWDGGNWFAPVAYRVDSGAHALAQDELFAPVLAMIEVDGIDEAIDVANNSRYGLSASVFTSDLSAAMRYIRDIRVGLVRVNGDTTGVDPHAPFGGMKGSSSGSREQGRAARDFYTETRTVQVHG